jgi:hypothetical protein
MRMCAVFLQVRTGKIRITDYLQDEKVVLVAGSVQVISAARAVVASISH